jgi:hypothetical protein
VYTGWYGKKKLKHETDLPEIKSLYNNYSEVIK